MELQLGLALPISTPIIKGFDLNFHVYEPKEVVGSNTLNEFGSIMSGTDTNENHTSKKRSYGEAFEVDRAARPTLPLLLWNNQPNKNDGDGGVVVGWPPVKNLRKRICIDYSQNGRSANNRTVENNKSKYVKVKMEGEGIGRKIDLNRYCSYQTLSDTLIDMFGKCQENVKDYNLTYQDSEGDWLLAGDVPWRSFIVSAQRLRLLRRSG